MGRHGRHARSRRVSAPIVIGLCSGAALLVGAGNALAGGAPSGSQEHVEPRRDSAAVGDRVARSERAQRPPSEAAPVHQRRSLPHIGGGRPAIQNIKIEDRRNYTIIRTVDGADRMRHYEPKGLVNVPGNQVGSRQADSREADSGQGEPERDDSLPVLGELTGDGLLGRDPGRSSMPARSEPLPCAVGAELVDSIVRFGAPLPLGRCESGSA